MNTVVILIAMEGEAEPLVQQLGLVKDESNALPMPFIHYSAQVKNTKVHIVCNGKDSLTGMDNIGTEGGATAAFLSIQAFKPDLLVTCGTCGGFKSRGATIGDVYLVTEFRRHDRRIPLPGYKQFADGVIAAVPTPQLQASNLGFKPGVLTTGNSFDFTSEDMERMEAGQANVKDMEGAAVAWACQQCGVACLGIKSVTDYVDTPCGGDQFLANFATAGEALQRAALGMVGFYDGKTIDEL